MMKGKRAGPGVILALFFFCLIVAKLFFAIAYLFLAVAYLSKLRGNDSA